MRRSRRADPFEQALRGSSGYKDFQARFVESSESRAGSGAARESGTGLLQAARLWRWEYTDPERKVVTIRGKEAEIAIEGDPQVSRYDLGSGDGPSGVGALLAGGEALSRSFAAFVREGRRSSDAVLRLDPLTLSDDYEYLLLRVRRSDQAILEVVIVDPGGNRLRFQFEDLRAGPRTVRRALPFTAQRVGGRARRRRRRRVGQAVNTGIRGAERSLIGARNLC
jgi:outer membrane lipoprotein-sorting protein